jgi:hypothetical protein
MSGVWGEAFTKVKIGRLVYFTGRRLDKQYKMPVLCGVWPGRFKA